MSRGIHSLWQSGTAAERGAYTTTGLGVPFNWWETDTEARYWWTGTGWAGLDITAGQALNVTTGGTLALGGFTLTAPATGTAVLGGGSGAANRMAYFSDANTLTSNAAYTVNAVAGSFEVAGYGIISRSWSTAQQSQVIIQSAGNVVGGAGANATLLFYDGVASIAGEFLCTVGNPIGTRTMKFTAGTDRDGVRIPFLMNVTNAAGAAYPVMAALAGASAGLIGFGHTVPDRLMHPELADAVTNAVSYIQRLTHICSTASTGLAAGGGVGIEFELETATDGTNRIAATIESLWVDATDATRKARSIFYAYDTAARECLRLEASGTAPLIGFFGHTAAAQQTYTAVSNPPTQAEVTAIRDCLVNLGLMAAS